MWKCWAILEVSAPRTPTPWEIFSWQRREQCSALTKQNLIFVIHHQWVLLYKYFRNTRSQCDSDCLYLLCSAPVQAGDGAKNRNPANTTSQHPALPALWERGKMPTVVSGLCWPTAGAQSDRQLWGETWDNREGWETSISSLSPPSQTQPGLHNSFSAKYRMTALFSWLDYILLWRTLCTKHSLLTLDWYLNLYQ